LNSSITKDLSLEQAQLMQAIMQRIITINAIPPYLKECWRGIPQDLKDAVRATVE
jgi:hypothetical protein